MTRKFSNRAEELRHHRKCFDLGLELGCTPAEAEAIIDQVEARERHRALCRKHGHNTVLPALKIPASRAEFEKFDCPWMGRN